MSLGTRGSVIRDILSGLIAQIFSFGLSFITSVLLARGLGPGGRGELARFTVGVTVAAGIAGFGLGGGVLRVLGRSSPENDRRLTSVAVITALILGLAGSGGILLLRSLGLLRDWEELTPYLALGLAVSILQTALSGSLMVRGLVIQANYGGVLARGFYAALIYTFVYILNLGPRGAVFAFLLSAFAGVAWLGFHARFALPSTRELRWVFQLLRTGIRGYFADLSSLFIYRVDQLMLAVMVGDTELGYYALAASLSEMVGLIPIAVTRAMHARYRGNSQQATAAFLRAWKLTMAVVLLGVVFLHWVGPWLLPILYGQEFLPAVRPFLVLLLAVFALASEKVTAAFRISRDFLGTNSLIAMMVLAINVVLNIWWIPKWGIVGAAWASFSAYWFGAILGIYVILRANIVQLRDLLPSKHDVAWLLGFVKKRK